MSQLFTDIWMKHFQKEWNKDSQLTGALKKINFNSNIGYGFPNEQGPRGIILVEQGQIIDAGSYNGQVLHWDLRAKEQHWLEWLNREVGKTGFALAYSTGKLKFIVGDYKSMIKVPNMASPFIKSFSVMGRACAS